MRLFLLLFLVSCSHNIINSVEVRSFVKSFERICGKKVTIPIYWGDLPTEDGSKTIGVCRGFQQSLLFRSIVLDKSYWNQATYWEKESLVFHELGHCVLDRPHVIGYDEKYRPLSIMHPFTFRSYLERRRYLVKELCGDF